MSMFVVGLFCKAKQEKEGEYAEQSARPKPKLLKPHEIEYS